MPLSPDRRRESRKQSLPVAASSAAVRAMELCVCRSMHLSLSEKRLGLGSVRTSAFSLHASRRAPLSLRCALQHCNHTRGVFRTKPLTLRLEQTAPRGIARNRKGLFHAPVHSVNREATNAGNVPAPPGSERTASHTEAPLAARSGWVHRNRRRSRTFPRRGDAARH